MLCVTTDIGVPGGKFLERGRIKKPREPTSGRLEYYTSSDFYIGAMVEFNKYRFVLTEADEYAYNYMEQHHDEVFHVISVYRYADIMWQQYLRLLVLNHITISS